ncbi:hypothetical protein LEL_10316 [Akanthomyces lecanii RCEF 1005]|uniref:Uncharacterized protein n=1 Tax=Akanthomyces lecanii RCEF 1005 TaxID=1081108 RepID=A0A167ZMG4_CORDF|nr:hypothetical protein LEL_10316 [Akanthomyces lecanii RCEF 1005]
MAPPDALPTAAISNRISMLVAAQSSVLATLSPSTTKRRTAAATAAVNHGKTQAELDDEALFKNNANPNEGVGYVAPRSGSAADKTKQDRELRGRVLGKRGQEIVAERERMQKMKKKKMMMEGESEDEDAGRSALGKRKRPRREVPQPSEAEDREKDEGVTEGDGRDEPRNEEDEEKRDDAGDVERQNAAAKQMAQPASTTTTTKRKKNKKKKNKTKA